MGDDFRLDRGALRLSRQDFGGAAVQRLAAAPEQAVVSRVLNQRVLEAIVRRMTGALDDEEVRRRRAGQLRTGGRGRRSRRQRTQQRVGKITPQDGADLRDFARFAKPVEPRRKRLLKRRRDCLQAAGLAALEQKARDLLDEQRHPASALAHALDHLLAKRMASGEFADHLRDVGAIEGAQRDDAVVGAQAPGRAKFRPGGRDDEQRRLRAALGERTAADRGRLGRPNGGLRRRVRPAAIRAPARYQAVIAANCRRRNSSGERLRRALFRQWDTHQRRDERRMFGGIETDQP